MIAFVQVPLGRKVAVHGALTDPGAFGNGAKSQLYPIYVANSRTSLVWTAVAACCKRAARGTGATAAGLFAALTTRS